MQQTQEAPISGTSTHELDDHRANRGLVWLAPLFALSAVVLVPVIVLLAVALPSIHRAEHWDVAWAGFDGMLALLLLAVAITTWRRSPWLEGAASAAATLLFVDAWFDVLTSSTQADLVMAIVEAVVVEVPLAVVCLLVARSAKQKSGLVRRDPAAVQLRLARIARISSVQT